MADLSEDLSNALFWARIIAGRLGVDEILPEHIVVGAFNPPLFMEGDSEPLQTVLRLPLTFAEDLSRLLGIETSYASEMPHGDLPLNAQSRDLIEAANLISAQHAQERVNALHFLLAAIRETAEIRNILQTAGLTEMGVERALSEKR